MREVEELTRADMVALVESGAELAAEVNLDDLLASILERAGALTNSPDTSVILKHDERPGLYFAAATGDSAAWVLTTFGKHSAKEIPLDGSKAGQVFTSGVSIVENKVVDHFAGVDDESKRSTESMVCVRLAVAGRPLGVMQILNKRSGEYTGKDRALLERFADQAAVAIRNAQLFEGMLAHSGFYTRFTAASDVQALMAEFQRPAHVEELTVMFADMRGFTQLIQSLSSPVEVQSRLNEFVSMLTEEVIVQNGMVNKLMGDSVMALFRAENHPERAVRAAFQMIERFEELKRRWNDESSLQLGFLDIGVGIATDRVTLGAMGSEKVRDFTAIGSAVNLAAAFEQQARNGNRVLVNHLAYRAVRDSVDAEALEDYVLKKPGQAVGIAHKCYALKRLKRGASNQVFVSYSNGDRERVQSELVEPLGELGIDAWVADNIEKGALWAAEIRNALSRCTWMVVVVSENARESDWVRIEVDMAMALGRLRGRIIPVLFDATPLASVNEFLASMQAVDARAMPDVAKSLAEQFERQAR